MSVKCLVCFFFLIRQISAQTLPTAPSGTFDLQLEKHGGPGASITAFVARNSHLYFAVSSPNGSLEFQTTREGLVERVSPIGAEQVSGFDVDDVGNSYVLYDGSHVSEFNSEGVFRRTLDLQSTIVSFVLLESRPLGVSPEGGLRSLEGSGGGFTLSAYPSPWLLFAVGADRLGVLRPQGPTLHLFTFEDGDASDASIVWPGAITSARKPTAAAADPEGKMIYLLGEGASGGSRSVIACDDHGTPKFIFNYAIAPGFNPHMIGVAGEHAYLVDRDGEVAFYSVDGETQSIEVLDAGPELLTDLAALRAAVRKAGYTGRVVIDININAQGSPEDARVSPAFLANVTEVMNAIRAWRFRPAIRAGKQAAVPMEFNVGVSPKP